MAGRRGVLTAFPNKDVVTVKPDESVVVASVFMTTIDTDTGVETAEREPLMDIAVWAVSPTDFVLRTHEHIGDRAGQVEVVPASFWSFQSAREAAVLLVGAFFTQEAERPGTEVHGWKTGEDGCLAKVLEMKGPPARTTPEA